MGVSSARCDASMVMPCQRTCAACNVPGSPRHMLCNRIEEEEILSLNGNIVELDHCFPGNSHVVSLRSAAKLFDPGGLTQVRSPNSKSVSDVYMIDAQPLGRGTYGEVYGATQRTTGARRAIKQVWKAGLRRYVKDVSSFVRREFEILRLLDHPHVVRIYEAFEDENMIHLVLELCDGGDLLERIAVDCTRLPDKEVATLLIQMLSAVQHMKLRGVVHRDIKPENFLFTRHEPDREPLLPRFSPVKIIDFGLSRRLLFEAGMRMTPKIGTSEYMAPEAFEGNIVPFLADRTDVWSIGVVLHVIFVGHFPSPMLLQQSPEKYLSTKSWDRVSVSGRDLLGQMLRRDPAKRPTVSDALRHPWLMSVLDDQIEISPAMPAAIRTFAVSPGLRRLGLIVAARETDDSDLTGLRQLYQVMQRACDGNLTREAAVKIAQQGGPAAAAAAEIVSGFDSIDTDNSGTVDWTELVAAALGALTAVKCVFPSPVGTACYNAGILSEPEPEYATGWMPQLQEDSCWRAFDLLSQGMGTISGISLFNYLMPCDAESWSEINSSNAICENTGMHEEIVFQGRTTRLGELDSLVQEVDVSGGLNRDGFLGLMQGLPVKHKNEAYLV